MKKEKIILLLALASVTNALAIPVNTGIIEFYQSDNTRFYGYTEGDEFFCVSKTALVKKVFYFFEN